MNLMKNVSWIKTQFSDYKTLSQLVANFNFSVLFKGLVSLNTLIINIKKKKKKKSRYILSDR